MKDPIGDLIDRMSEETTITGCSHTENESISQEYVCAYCEVEKADYIAGIENELIKARAEIERLNGELRGMSIVKDGMEQYMGELKATIEAVRGLVEKWRSEYDQYSRHPWPNASVCAAELEAKLKEKS